MRANLLPTLLKALVLVLMVLALPSIALGQSAGDNDQNQQPVETSIRLIAAYTTEGPVIDAKVTWRIFKPDQNEQGVYPLVVRSDDPSPVFVLQTGTYIVHAAFGYARTTQLIQLGAEPQILTLIIPAGGLYLESNIGENGDDPQVSYDVLGTELDALGERRILVSNAPVKTIIPLAEGAYQIISRYGNGNSVVREDVIIEAGLLTLANVEHRAARITFKLVSEAGGEALADTSWTILLPNGDVVKEGIGAFPTYVLAEGDYSVVASNGGESFTRDFSVVADDDAEIELLITRSGL